MIRGAPLLPFYRDRRSTDRVDVFENPSDGDIDGRLRGFMGEAYNGWCILGRRPNHRVEKDAAARASHPKR